MSQDLQDLQDLDLPNVKDPELLKPKVVPVHDLHTKNTFFSEEQLAKDPEARELEDLVFTHGKAPSVEINSSQFDQPFYTIDDLGNKIPSQHAMTTFNEFGVNEEGQTVSQVLEQEREAKQSFDEFAERWMNIQTRMQQLKTEQKELELEFKDQGLEVGLFKKAIKWRQQYQKKTQEDRWVEGVMRQWALGSSKLTEALEKLERAQEETKEVGKDREQRQQTLLNNMTKKFDARYEHDKQTGRGHLDNMIEQQAVFASFGAPRAEEEFIKLEEQKKIRDARRKAGLEDLAMFSNELQPANRAQHKEVFGEEFHKRREEFEAKRRENELFDPTLKEQQWHLDYEPTDVPVTFDFDELVKHGLNQVKKMEDAAFIVKQARKGLLPLPDANWVKKFDNLTKPQIDELIKLGARAEDYLENKIVCDQLYLPDTDDRRNDWMTPAMRIARWNRLVRLEKIDGDEITYDPVRDFLQVKEIPDDV